jgi:hypothetical protein
MDMIKWNNSISVNIEDTYENMNMGKTISNRELKVFGIRLWSTESIDESKLSEKLSKVNAKSKGIGFKND